MEAVKAFELLARTAAKELSLPSTTGPDNDIATLWLACLVPAMAETRHGEFLKRKTSADVFSESAAVLNAMAVTAKQSLAGKPVTTPKIVSPIDNERPNEFSIGPLIGTKTEFGFAIRYPRFPALTTEQGLRHHFETIASRPNSPFRFEDAGANKIAVYFRDVDQFQVVEARLKVAPAFIKTLQQGKSKKVRESGRKPAQATSPRKSK